MMHRRLSLSFLIAALLVGVCLPSALPANTLVQDKEEPPPTDEIKGEKKSSKKSKKTRKAQLAALPEKYALWLASVDMIISKEERDSFLDLEKDYQRDAFVERFWKARDPYPTTVTNEFRQRYEEATKVVMERYGDFDSDRSKVYLVNEPPDVMMSLSCHEMWPAEVWFWQKNKKVGTPVGILFYQSGGGGRYRIWYPDEGIDALAKFPGVDANSVIESCNMHEQEALGFVISLVRNMGTMGFMSLMADVQETPSIPRGEWVETFHAYSTDLDEGAAEFPARLEIEFPGRHQSRTVVQGIIKVPKDKVTTSQLAEYGQTYNIMLTGEVIRENSLFDTFRYQYNFPIEQIVENDIPLIFDRYLRPGNYDLVLKLEDLNSDAEHREEVKLSVPEMEKEVPVTPSDPETARILEEANAAISSGDTTIKIVPLRGQYSTGMMRVDTLTTGRDIAEVIFDLDGGQRLSKTNPPWSVELDLGSLPQMRTLKVSAMNSAGISATNRDGRLYESTPCRRRVSA